MRFFDINKGRPIISDCDGCGLRKEINVLCFRFRGVSLLCCDADCWNKNLASAYGSLEDDPAAGQYAGEPNFAERRQAENRRTACDECDRSRGRASVSSRHAKHCYKYRIDGHLKMETTFSAYGSEPAKDPGPRCSFCFYQDGRHDDLCPEKAAQSTKIDYQVGEQTSYPIPDGYAMLPTTERLRVGDKVWNIDSGRFELAGDGLIDLMADVVICPIRMLPFEAEKIRAAQGFSFGYDAAGGKDFSIAAIPYKVYCSMVAVVDAWNDIPAGVYIGDLQTLPKAVEKLAAHFKQ